jgi:alanyl-tRNA synthetase
MKGHEIRESFIRFFEGRGHLHQPSASLIPAGDPTLLFTSAGMVPLKPFFMGEQTPPSRRLTSYQKSFRTTDIDEVGDHKHLTFFEMLGNFSIGDYFKKDAVSFAWELVTELFQIPHERIFVTVHLDDDEAYEIWLNDIGIPEERIYRYGDKDNWWGPAGTEGPTGPCSELHYDGGAEKGCGDMVTPDRLAELQRQEMTSGEPVPVPGCHPNCDCERFVELWNLVFMQFYQDPQRNRTPLPAPSVDTGMGLERAAAVLQGKSNVYETDLFWPIVQQVCALTGKTYGADQGTDYAIRVVAEHARATCFLIGDGVVPGNAGRGYVLRRIIRRAIRYGRRLGLEEPFLPKVAEVVLESFGLVYRELQENHDFILRVIQLEEERFSEAMQTGMRLLEDQIIPLHKKIGAAAGDAKQISGEEVFLLHDTSGFPPELTADIARENGLTVDLEGFEREMAAQREQSRAAQAFSGSMEMLTAYENLGVGQTQFVGYQELKRDTVLLAILVDLSTGSGQGAPQGHATQGQQVEIVLQDTPFYAEGGGQVGDRGTITGPNGVARITDTQSPVAGLTVHHGVVERGDLSLGEAVTAEVEVSHRLDSARNHSGTHLLHAALRSVLGPHVRQAGSLVTPERLRFDFSHVSALSPQEQLSVQGLANEKVRENLRVSTHETSYADAVREGALAFFGDRYGDVVRVVAMSPGDSTTDSTATGHDNAQQAPFSVEVCGGTHVAATGQVGTLFVLGESSIGGGMRRIEAVTGRAAEELFVEQGTRLEALSRRLQTPVADLEARLDSFLQDTEDLRRRLTALERSSLRGEAEEMLGRVQDVEGVKVVASRTSAGSAEAMREMGDFLKGRLSSVVVVLAAIVNDNPLLVAMVTTDLVTRGLHAGNIARDTARVMGGGGGGQAEMAQAGGRQPEKLDAALQGVPELVRSGLRS